MANEDIKSKINEMNHAISRIQSEIAIIEDELNAISQSAYANKNLLIASSALVNNSMENNSNVLVYSNNMIRQTYDAQLQIKELFFIFKDIETANKKIRALNNKLFYEFKNQSKVRKIVTGFLDNLNLDLVDNERIYKAIEKEHLQTPDFWLTYVLLAIMAWKQEDRKQVEKCMNGALTLNKKSTTVFMMYFNLIIGRVEPALKWFSLYKEMEKVGKDDKTLLMLVCSISNKINQIEETTDVMTKEILNYIQSEVSKGMEEVNQAEVVSNIEKYLESFDLKETMAYDNYRKYVKDYQDMADALSLAKNNAEILDYFDELSHVLLNERNTYLDEYIQEVINEPCEGEKDIVEEIAYNEEIIKTVNIIKERNGLVTTNSFKELAKEKFEKKKIHDEVTLNSFLEIYNWTYGGKNLKITTLAKWNLFVLNKPFTVAAYEQYCQKYQSLNHKTHQISIGDFSCKTEFKNQEKDIENVNTYINDRKQYLLKKAIKPMFYVGIGLAILCLVLMIMCLTMIKSVQTKNILSILSGVGIGVFALVAVWAYVKNIFKKKNIVNKMSNEQAKIKDIVIHLYEEKADYDREFLQADDISNQIKAFFETF